MTRKINRVHVEESAYCVKKLRQNVGLETWIWRQNVTSQTAHTKYKWPPYATEWNPTHENFLRTTLEQNILQRRWRQNHRVTDTLLTLLFANP